MRQLTPTIGSGEQRELSQSLVTAMSTSARSSLRQLLLKGDLLIGDWDFSQYYAVLQGRPSIAAALAGWNGPSSDTISSTNCPAKWRSIPSSAIKLEPWQLAYYESELSSNALRAALRLKNTRRTTRKVEDELFADL